MPEDKKPETFELDAEVFSAGVWNNDKYTTDDLDMMVDSFNQLNDQIKPPVKLGHNDNQLRDGQPALGWVKSLKRVGDKLVARLTELPALVYAAIQSGRYKRVSSEIMWDLKHLDRTHKRVLWAVSLLGADIPAVSNLKDLGSSLGALMSAASKDGLHFESLATYEFSVDTKGTINSKERSSTDMDNEAKLKQYEADIEAKDKANEELNAKIAKYEADMKAREERDLSEKSSTAVKDVKAYCEEMVTKGKMTPAFRDKLYAAIGDGTHTYSMKDSTIMVPVTLIKEYAEEVDKVFVKEDESGSSQRKKEYVSAGEEIDAKANAIVAEGKMSYIEATSHVLRTDHELAEKYARENRETYAKGDA